MGTLHLKRFVKDMTIVCACFLMVSMTSVAQTQEQAQEKPQPKQRKFYLSFGGSFLMIGDTPFGGGSLSFGYKPSPKNLWIFEIEGGGGDSQNLGSYSYSLYNSNTGQIIETKNDGKITYNYSLYEATIAWNRVVKMPKKWDFRFGPCIGLLTLTGGDHYSPTSYKGIDIEGIPETQSESKSVIMGGVIAGFTWNFAKRWFMDTNYRLSVNQSVEFPSRAWSALGHSVAIQEKEFGSLSNRINISIGVRL